MATQTMHKALLSKDFVTWLEPPTNMGVITIVDISKTDSFIEYEAMVYKWGKSVWNAWTKHLNQIRKWATHRIFSITWQMRFVFAINTFLHLSQY